MTFSNKHQRVSLAITGASGVRYGLRMLEVLVGLGHRVELMISDSGLKCLQIECHLPAERKALLHKLEIPVDRVGLHDASDITAPLASGSSIQDLYAGFIVPCSMGTCARIAMGVSGNLIERHADVLIKERKSLVLVPRETPLSEIHLQNLLKLTQLGCFCVPAMPGFYHDPGSIDQLVDHVVGKALDVVKIEHQLYKRWQS